MKVLITGGAGYVGGALTDIISDLYDVIVYDSLLYEEHYLKPVNFVKGDVRDHDKLKPLLDWADCVIWLAAVVGDGACAINPGVTNEVNKESVKWLSENFDGRIIFMSTCSVYGARNGVLDESSPTNPLSLYASTKLDAEAYLESKNSIIFRLGTLFGLGDDYSRIRLDLVINTLTARAVSEGKLQVFGGDQYRPLLHVKDAAQMIADHIESGYVGVYNLHYENMTVLEMAKLVDAFVPVEMEIVETKFEDSRNYKASSDKARKIGFYPTYSVEDGIKELTKLLKDQRVSDLNNRRYSNVGFLEEAWKS